MHQRNLMKISLNSSEASGEFEKRLVGKSGTTGSDLEDILIHPSVDPYETASNNIWEVYEMFGIEAARKMLYKEIR